MGTFTKALILLILFAFSQIILAANPCYGPTLENEHLYRIAMRVRCNHCVSVQQVMLAILNANASAFNSKNINGLKSGYRLKIPSLYVMSQIPAEAAFHKVSQQNASWKNKSAPSVSHEKPKEKLRSHPAKHLNIAKKLQPSDHIESILPSAKAGEEKTTLTDIVKQQNVDSPLPASSPSTASITPPNPAPATSTFMEDSKKSQQQTNTQIADLQKQTQALQAKVNQLEESLRAVTYHFIQLASKSPNQNSDSYAKLRNNIKQYAWPLLIGLLALIFLLYLLKRTFTKPTAPPPKSAKEQGEYDFLNDKENIASKLDLARAYIDMGDTAAAKEALEEVLAKGNAAQKKQAKTLLNKIKI